MNDDLTLGLFGQRGRLCELCGNEPPMSGDVLCRPCDRRFLGIVPESVFHDPDVSDVLRVLNEMRGTT